MPNFSFTLWQTALLSATISSPVAPPLFTSTSACFSYTPALPRLLPFHPHLSIIHPAGILTLPLG